MYRIGMVTVCVVGFLLLGACRSPDKVVTVEDHPAPGTTSVKVVKEQRVDGEVQSRLTRIFEYKVITGEGVYTSPTRNETEALHVALNLAINDLAKRAGEVFSSEDSKLYNSKNAESVIRTKAAHIVRGYNITRRSYDALTGRATVEVSQTGRRLAKQISECLR